MGGRVLSLETKDLVTRPKLTYEPNCVAHSEGREATTPEAPLRAMSPYGLLISQSIPLPSLTLLPKA